MKTHLVEAVDLCNEGNCPLHVNHFDRELERTPKGALWAECLHPSLKAPELDYHTLKANGFAIPDDCPLREGPLTLAIPTQTEEVTENEEANT